MFHTFFIRRSKKIENLQLVQKILEKCRFKKIKIVKSPFQEANEEWLIKINPAKH